MTTNLRIKPLSSTSFKVIGHKTIFFGFTDAIQVSEISEKAFISAVRKDPNSISQRGKHYDLPFQNGLLEFHKRLSLQLGESPWIFLNLTYNLRLGALIVKILLTELKELLHLSY